MPIIALGLDLTEIARVEAVWRTRGRRFLERVFTTGELEYCLSKPRPALHLAGRFAVKEAAMKALGTGWKRGVRWVDLEVRRRQGGAPELLLHGASAQIAQAQGIARIHITITHDGGLAAAVAVAERD